MTESSDKCFHLGRGPSVSWAPDMFTAHRVLAVEGMSNDRELK